MRIFKIIELFMAISLISIGFFAIYGDVPYKYWIYAWAEISGIILLACYDAIQENNEGAKK
jgi:hypothetical protein